MNTKYLTLLGAIIIYYTLAPDIERENEKLIRDIKLVECKISSEDNTSDIVKKVQRLAHKDKTIDNSNRALFIDSKLPDALAFSSLQKSIRDDANQSKGELTNLSWGEPSTKDDSLYTLLPLSISYNGSPMSCAQFLDLIHKHSKLLYIENLSIVEYQSRLSMTADLYSYRLADTKKIRKE